MTPKKATTEVTGPDGYTYRLCGQHMAIMTNNETSDDYAVFEYSGHSTCDVCEQEVVDTHHTGRL